MWHYTGLNRLALVLDTRQISEIVENLLFIHVYILYFNKKIHGPLLGCLMLFDIRFLFNAEELSRSLLYQLGQKGLRSRR